MSNFIELPFNIYFTNPYSPLPVNLTSLNFSSFFTQISAGIIPNSPPPERLRLVETEFHYRYVIDRTPFHHNTQGEQNIIQESQTPPENSTDSNTASDSTDSLPELVPISDISSTLSLNNIEVDTSIDFHSNLLSTEPPPYSFSRRGPPAYQTSKERELIPQQIRILERESSEERSQIVEDHH